MNQRYDDKDLICIYNSGCCVSVMAVLLFDYYVKSVSMVGHPSVFACTITSNNTLDKESLHCHCDHMYHYVVSAAVIKNKQMKDNTSFLSPKIGFKNY